MSKTTTTEVTEKLAETAETVETAEKTEAVAIVAAETADPNRKVRIRLFKDSNKYKNDVFVGVNGETFQLQRGVEIDVPWYVKEALDNSDLEDTRTATKIEELVLDYEKQSKK